MINFLTWRKTKFLHLIQLRMDWETFDQNLMLPKKTKIECSTKT